MKDSGSLSSPNVIFCILKVVIQNFSILVIKANKTHIDSISCYKQLKQLTLQKVILGYHRFIMCVEVFTLTKTKKYFDHMN